MRHEDCWAKTTKDAQGREVPGISVRDHCLNVGCVAAALIERLPEELRARLPPGAATVAALHDIGKVSPGFQQLCPAWRERNASWFRPKDYEKRHALISQEFLQRVKAGRLRRAAEAVGAHHGLVQGAGSSGDMGGTPWHAARLELVQELEREVAPLPPDDLADEAAEWLLAGLTAVADWLASNEDLFSPENRGPLAKADQRRIADKAVDQLGLAGAAAVPGLTFAGVFADRLQGGSPRPLQQRVLEMAEPVPAVYVIEDAMGSGKTEAALWLTYRLISGGLARGMNFALPTRVTSDRIHRRVERFLEQVSPTHAPMLVHGQAWLRDAIPRVIPLLADVGCGEGEERAAEAIRRWFASTRRGLLAPFAVGTVDQALLGVIAAKWFFVRQFALAGKVVVLDEVHSYDLYTGTLIRQLVRRLRELNATPVILSATLTARQKAELLGEAPPAAAEEEASYPAVTVKRGDGPAVTSAVAVASGGGAERSVRVVTVPVPSFEEVAGVVAMAVRLAEEGRNVVWIRNTVNQAQEAYRRLNSERRGTDYEIGLLHSRFPAFQRSGRPNLDLDALKRQSLHEERWLWMLGKPEPPRQDARPRASILVSTQVVEQSVDIDADVLITDLAPTDMLLQRLGRLHRHSCGERGTPTVFLVVPQSLVDGAESLSAEPIKQALGAVGRVYDPYVLMRSWAQWRKREAIALPREIRRVLEATYAEPKEEPESWVELREELKRKKEAQEGKALSAVDVRGRPLGQDEEGFGTRLGGPAQVLLLMLRCCAGHKDTAGNPVEIQLLNTRKLELAEYVDFNVPAARQLHANTATIPAWWAPFRMRNRPPRGLAQYFADDILMGVWNPETLLVELDLRGDPDADDKSPKVCYRPDMGLWLDRPPPKEQRAEDEGEDDEGIL